MLKQWIAFWLSTAMWLQAQEATHLLDDKDGSLTKIASSLLGNKSPNDLFYVPTFDEPRTPKTLGYQYENLIIPSTQGAKLHAWFLPARTNKKITSAKGTIVFAHGNAGSLGHHLFLATFFVDAGYNLLMFDYRGFGKSQGSISRRALIDDAESALQYASTFPKIDCSRLIAFGHSMGGAKMIAALGEKHFKGVRGLLTYGAFASYRDMAKVFAGDVGQNLATDENAPIQLVSKVAPIPYLLVHGTADEIVPFSQAMQLFEKAQAPKTFFKVKNGDHGSAMSMNDHEYEKRVLAWLDQTLKDS